jgi:hypothetical protein
VIVAVPFDPTTVVVIVNVASDLPPGITTAIGGMAATPSLDNETITPPGGAGPVRVTVPVEDFPPLTLAGLNVKVESAGGVIVRVAFTLDLPTVAVRVSTVCADTDCVFTVKLTDSFPAGIVTFAGNVKPAWAEVKATDTPPVGATPVRATVPIELVPPATVEGLNDSDPKVEGLIVI